MENTGEKIADKIFAKARRGDKVAFQELNRLAENDNARAMSNLAQIYLKGLCGVKSSYKRAVELFERAAAFDEVYALYRLGEFYRDAKCGFAQDGHRAAEYFIRAAEKAAPNGAIKSLRAAAEIFHYGKGSVQPDGLKAIELYEKLDEIESRGEVEIRFTVDKALFRIASIYMEGCGSVRPDGLKALEYLNKAIARGDDRAFHELEKIYRCGKAGLPIDGYKIIECLESRRTYREIAEIYLDGKYNVRADGRKAIEYFSKEAERDKGKTFDEITARYFQSGCDDMNQANEYFDAVEKICNFTMPKEIAEIFLEGKGGVQPDGYKALEYLAQTVEGINKAIELTKNFVASNEDVQHHYPEILKRFFDRSERRLKDVYEQIAEIYRCGKCGVLPNGQKALALYERLDEIELRGGKNKAHFESTALFRIVDIYAKGCGSVQIDGRRAVEYLIESIERGYPWAFHWLKELYDEEKIDIEIYGHKLIGYFLKYAQEQCSRINDEPEDFLFFTKDEIAESFKIVARIYFKLNDIPKALEYFLKADEYGDSWAYIDVAKIYRNGGFNFKADGEKLIEFLTKKLAKAEIPDDTIICGIAEIYEEGCASIEPNMKKALEFYRKAAELGNTFAEKKLADLIGAE